MKNTPLIHGRGIKRVATLAAAISAASTASIVSTSALAQTVMLEEIIVTAQKRAESLQDVPISVNVLDGEKLNDTGTTDLEGLSNFVPNFTINQTGISTTISIRGISSGINQGFEQSVGMYVDGIYLGRAQLARAPLFDLQRVEVLRGPQSILFGKNSIAGAVNIETARPTDVLEGSITLLYEPNHSERDARFVISGPLTDTLSGRLALMGRSFGGYYENTLLNQDEPDKEEQVFRGTLVWDATDDLRATLKVEKAKFDVSGRNIEVIEDTADGTIPGLSTIFPVLTGGQPLESRQDFKRQANGDVSKNDTESVVLNLEYLWGENTITSVTGYTAYDYDELCDCDYTAANTFTLGLEEEFDQFSQELRIASPTGETFEYIAGLFYQTSDLFFSDDFNIPATSGLTGLPTVGSALAGYNTVKRFDQDADLWSVFAQATWNVSDTLRLTLGGRFTDESKDATRSAASTSTSPTAGVVVAPGVTLLDLAENALRAEPHQESGTRDETAFTPLANVQFDLNENVMLYATYTTGFKSGGFDVRSNASTDPLVGVPAAISDADPNVAPSPVGVFEFEEEEAESIELGAKTSLLNGAAELNIAVYRTDYEDLQVSIFDGGLGFNVGNAAEAEVQGVELDGRWAVTESLQLSGALAYLDFEFKDYDNGECYFRQETLEPSTVTNAALSTCSFDGERQVYTPEWTASLSADYVIPVGDDHEFTASLNLNYYDNYLVSPSLDPRVEQDAFTKVGARVAIASVDGDWEVALIGKNLTDESVVTYAAELPASGTLVAGATGGQEGLAYYGFFDRPRSVAIQGRYNF